jgi:TRAP-type C4-dicarboxylate transport system substrate-binding protein
VSVQGESCKYFLDLVTERTEGQVTFRTFYGGAAAASAPEHFQLVEGGAIDMAYSAEAYEIGKYPTGLFEYSFPFGPGDVRIVQGAKKQLREEYPVMNAEFAKNNLVPIALFGIPVYTFLSKEPLATFEDFEGKKIGAIGKYFGRWIEAAGGVPVNSAEEERYELLRTGMTDGDLLHSAGQLSWKLYELTNYFMDRTFLACSAWSIVVNEDVYSRFSPKLKEIFAESAIDAEQQMVNVFCQDWTDRAHAAFRENNVEFLPFPDSEVAKWAAVMPDTPAELAADLTENYGYPGWELVERYQDICEEMGYEWPMRWGVRK